MRRKNNIKRISSIIWEIALLAVSAVLILNAFEITSIEMFFDGWWTLFIIVLSFIGLFNDNDKTGNIIGLLIGIFLLLACQNILDFDIMWELMVPVIIAIIGIKMIFGGIDNKKHQNSKDNQYTVYLNGTCIFGGVDVETNHKYLKCEEKDDILKISETRTLLASHPRGMKVILTIPKDKIFNYVDIRAGAGTVTIDEL